MAESKFRSLPSVDKLVSDKRIKELAEAYSHSLVVSLVRLLLDELRLSIVEGKPCPPFEKIARLAQDKIEKLARPSLRPVINATGVIIHTNLGRAPLSSETIAAMDLAARDYCNLELDLDSGKRGSRQVHIEPLLCQLTGAEAALAVNNNASALLLALSALAKGKEVIVSRGQAVEIGGGVRIPEIMRQSGAKLVEVGTTNCTYITDFEAAITPKTAALLRVHSSNFKLIGFTESVALEQLVELGSRHNLTVLDDLGSGCLLDTTRFGLAPEPIVQQSVALGVGLALFSGDKLLGGPQAGLVVGRKPLIDKLKKHPLARAVRIDKGRLAGIDATLRHYMKGEELGKIPIWSMISTSLESLEKRAQRWVQYLGPVATVVEGESVVGGGSLPGSTLPTRLVAIRAAKGSVSVPELASRLRHQEPSVVARIEANLLLLDPRTVLPEQEAALLQAVHNALNG